MLLLTTKFSYLRQQHDDSNVATREKKLIFEKGFLF